MKTLHFDCFAGISGDMTLGALVDLGADPGELRRELEKLGLSGWDLTFRREERGGIDGLRALLTLEGEEDHNAQDGDRDQDGGHHHHDYDDGHSHGHDGHGGPRHHHDHDDEHSHGHDGHGGPHHHHDHDDGHSHDHGHDGHGHHHEHDQDGAHHHHDYDDGHSHGHHGHGGPHHHHTWKDIRALIERSGIRAGAKKRALDIFGRIAAAEAQVHGTEPDDIAFHEVGALDSIIDIVGAAVCLDLLGPERITCGEVELGGGTVRCAHGVLPVPAPAILLLVRGMPVKTGGFSKEMTTPTGAAILAASVDEFISGAAFREIKTGYGAGSRKTEKPNLLRVSWREEGPPPSGGGWKTEELIFMEANIDDMSGEALGFLMENLFGAGALDVTFTPCVMKKSRPGTIVSVLAPPEKLDSLRRALFEKSSTAGFREIPVRRLSLSRRDETITGPSGEARRKTLLLDGEVLRSKIEFEDRSRLARERKISLAEAERILNAGGQIQGEDPR